MPSSDLLPSLWIRVHFLREIVFSHFVLGAFSPHWKLISCGSYLLISPLHSISSIVFTTAYASRRSTTVSFLRWVYASVRFEVVVGSMAHLGRYLIWVESKIVLISSNPTMQLTFALLAPSVAPVHFPRPWYCSVSNSFSHAFCPFHPNSAP